MYYRDVKAVLLVLDSAVPNSSQQADQWLHEFIDSSGCSQHTGNSTDLEHNTLFALVANKTDKLSDT